MNVYNGNYYQIVLKNKDNKNKALKIIFDGKTYDVKTDNKGIYNFQINVKSQGSYSIKVIYNGDKVYNSTSKTAKITVKKQKTNLKIKSKTKKIIKIKLTNQFKKSISKATVKLTINKKTYKSKTDKKGIASFKLNLKNKKKYKFTAKFIGNNYYLKSSKTAYLRL